MEALTALARCEDTELGRLGRAALAGLAATLETAMVHAPPDDPARTKCQEAAHTLRRLLNTPQPPGATSPPDDSPRGGTWADLGERWSLQPEWKSILGSPEPPADLPKWLWLLTHRLPPSVADSWRGEWLAVAEVPPGSAWLVPPLPDGSPGVSLTSASERLTGDAGPIAHKMGEVASAVLAFAAHDASLRHMLRSVFRFGTTALQGAQRSRYEQAVVDRWSRLRQAEQDGEPAELVRAWVDLDEAIHSLTHLPPAHAQSTFGQLGAASRQCLAVLRERLGEAPVHVQVLAGRYAECRRFTEADADVELPGAPPGDVTTCVRVFARIDGTAHPGRVAYTPR